MTEEERNYICNRTQRWLDAQPETEAMMPWEMDRAGRVLIGVICGHKKGFSGTLGRNDLREAYRLADDADLKLLPLYCKFMEDEQRRRDRMDG